MKELILLSNMLLTNLNICYQFVDTIYKILIDSTIKNETKQNNINSYLAQINYLFTSSKLNNTLFFNQFNTIYYNNPNKRLTILNYDSLNFKTFDLFIYVNNYSHNLYKIVYVSKIYSNTFDLTNYELSVGKECITPDRTTIEINPLQLKVQFNFNDISKNDIIQCTNKVSNRFILPNNEYVKEISIPRINCKSLNLPNKITKLLLSDIENLKQSCISIKENIEQKKSIIECDMKIFNIAIE